MFRTISFYIQNITRVVLLLKHKTKFHICCQTINQNVFYMFFIIPLFDKCGNNVFIEFYRKLFLVVPFALTNRQLDLPDKEKWLLKLVVNERCPTEKINVQKYYERILTSHGIMITFTNIWFGSGSFQSTLPGCCVLLF